MTLISSLTQLGSLKNQTKELALNQNNSSTICGGVNSMTVYNDNYIQTLLDLHIKINILGIIKLDIHIKL